MRRALSPSHPLSRPKKNQFLELMKAYLRRTDHFGPPGTNVDHYGPLWITMETLWKHYGTTMEQIWNHSGTTMEPVGTNKGRIAPT